MRLRVGDVEIVSLLDAVSREVDPLDAFPEVDPAELRRAEPAFDRPLVEIPIRCHLIRTPGLTAIVDTGYGPWQRHGRPAGRLDDELRAQGLARADIDVVVATHLHEDHVGWNTIPGRGGPPEIGFPNARYLIQAREWAYWMGRRADDRGRNYVRECILPLRDRADLRLVEPDHEVCPQVDFIAAAGHTPGHVAVRVASRGETLVIGGDVSHFPLQVAHPEWSSAWDEDPLQASRTRTDLFHRLADDPDTLLLANHWPEPGIGHVIRRADRLAFRPVLPSREPSNAHTEDP